VTNPEQLPGPDDDQEHDGDVLAVRESTSVLERLKTTTCRWCGQTIEYAGVGRPPLYCRDSHRKRASELRTAQRRAARPVAEGGQTTEPVREVIERTETRTHTTVRRGPAKLRLPKDIHQWQHTLKQLQNEVRSGHLTGFREILVRDLEETLRIVRDEQKRLEQQTGKAPAQRPTRPQGSKKKRRKRR
jgi:hypothetical protein